MQLGCIADDFTGATDLAHMFVSHGVPAVVLLGIPPETFRTDSPVVVVALKSRSAPTDVAVSQSVSALRWLKAQGCDRFYFKYCSTFDSTPRGNIGPVTDALMAELDTDFTIACPAFPANGRTVYNGHLFVGTNLLHESSMRDHPITPMDDANLVRLLQRQTTSQVGLIRRDIVSAGPAAIRADFAVQRSAGVALAVIDAIDEIDLAAIGSACADLPLVTAAAGLAIGLAAMLPRSAQGELPAAGVGGACAVVAGSASHTTAAQISAMRISHPAYEVTPQAVLAGEDVVSAALSWATPLLPNGPVLVHAAATRVNNPLAAERLEAALAQIAHGLVRRGVRRLVVAGGETSGAVVRELGVRALQIGPEISPGVPWTLSVDAAQPIALALKSGNFGSVDMFTRAFEIQP